MQLISGSPDLYTFVYNILIDYTNRGYYTNRGEVKTKKLKLSRLVYLLQSLTSALDPQAVLSCLKLVKSRLQAVHKPAASLRQAFFKLATSLLQTVLNKLISVCTVYLLSTNKISNFLFKHRTHMISKSLKKCNVELLVLTIF